MKLRKIFFLYDSDKNKFLLGGFLQDSSSELIWLPLRIDALESGAEKSEIRAKTGLYIEEVFDLNWGSVSIEDNKEVREMYFIAFLNSKKTSSLNSHLYKWLNLDSFVRKIRWRDNKKLLIKVLSRGVKKECYFDKKERGQ